MLPPAKAGPDLIELIYGSVLRSRDAASLSRTMQLRFQARHVHVTTRTRADGQPAPGPWPDLASDGPVDPVSWDALATETQAAVRVATPHRLVGFAPVDGALGVWVELARPTAVLAFTPGVEAALCALLPHFAQACAIGRRLDGAVAMAHAAASLVESLTLPCLITDRAGRCIEGNAAFRAAVQRGRLPVITGRLQFADPTLQGQWETALAETHLTGLARSTHVGEWQIACTPWVAPPGFPAAADARLMLAVFQGMPAEVLHADVLAPDATGLTHAEQDVLGAVLQGMTAKSIAGRRGASVNTVRSQIMAILGKTGFRSQKELIASFGNSGFSASVPSDLPEDSSLS